MEQKLTLQERLRYKVEVKTPTDVLINRDGLTEGEARAAVEEVKSKFHDDHKLQECIKQALSSFGFTGMSDGGYSVTVYGGVPTVVGEEKHTCLNRTQQLGPWEKTENIDTWDLVGDDLCCSFCGSIKPSNLIQLVKDKGFAIIEPTRKGYKWYINRPEVKNSGYGALKYYRWHDTPEFVQEWNKLIKNNQ